ncbi:MAG: GspH/FimT family pseudopilin [Gemmatimonadaceae bacterium]
MRHAFSVFELTVSVGILGILSAVTIPRAARLLDRVHVNGAAEEIAAVFGAARHVAIARGAQTTVDIDAVEGSMSVSAGDIVIRKHGIAASHGVLISASRSRMSYSATGMGYGAANLSVVVKRNSVVDTVFVSRLGRVRH